MPIKHLHNCNGTITEEMCDECERFDPVQDGTACDIKKRFEQVDTKTE